MLSTASLPGMALSSKATRSKGFGAACAPCRRGRATRTAAAPPRAFRVDEDTRSQQAGVEKMTPFQEALPDAPFKVEPQAVFTPAFTRRREHMVGRAAMVGVAAAWVGEILTGMGPMSQLASELHVPVYWAFWATGGLALYHLIAGLNRNSPTFSPGNQRDLARRSKGITGITVIEPDTRERVSLFQDPGKFGVRLELTLGRVAMPTFAGAMLLEYLWNGQSPLEHMGLITPTMTSLGMAPTWLKGAIGLFALGGLGVFSGFDTRKDVDVY